MHVQDISSLIHKKGVLTPTVVTLFNQLGVYFKTLEEANEYAQKNLLRSEERWEQQAKKDIHTLLYAKQTVLLKLLQQLYMIDPLEPSIYHHTYALIMGSLKEDVIARLDYLAQLYTKGYNCTVHVLLSGERPLLEEEKNGLPETITTEIEMVNFIYDQYPLFKQHMVLSINAPMVPGSVRPTTDSTLKLFALQAPSHGSCLVVSENPFILRQTKTAQRLLDQSCFPTEGAGGSIKEKDKDIVLLMDEFARLLYEDYKAWISKQGK